MKEGEHVGSRGKRPIGCTFGEGQGRGPRFGLFFRKGLRRAWALQRFGWLALAAFLIAGLLGYFGQSPRSEEVVKNEQLELSYERFPHLASPSQVQIKILEQQTQEFRVRINRSYLEDFTIQRILPPPQRVESAKDHEIFVFQALGSGSIRIELQATKAGRKNASFSLEPGPELPFEQFVYP